MELKAISDTELLSSLSSLVKTEKQTTLKILEYLGEVDSRRLWLREGYSSLFDFCVRHLKYSEGETARRIQGCRTLVKFEEVKPVLAKDEISLTALCLLSPHMTASNVMPLLDAAKNQSTRQVEKIIEQHFPESKQRPRILSIELDDELEALLEKAKLELSEKMPSVVFKRTLKDFLKIKSTRKSFVQKHTRYVPQSIKREVKIVDGNQCSFVGTNGIRCNQRYHLQFDHIRPYGKGGSSLDVGNIRLLCKSHNLMRAKEDFPDRRISREM